MITHKRKIYIVGEINDEAYEKFSKRLGYLESISYDEVHIVLSSHGGTATTALAFYDRIRMSYCPISITATGLVASAAALILVAPRDISRRTITSSAWVMVHDECMEEETFKGMRTNHASRYVSQLQAFEDQWNALMAENTNTSAVTWAELHAKETYLTANDCLKLGVVGSII